MRVEVEIRNDEEFIKVLFKALKVEEKDSISKAKVYQSDNRLILSIEADDISDLRAAINSWLRLIKMCSEIWYVESGLGVVRNNLMR
jgi:KEOPS complex subunit Pcc1